jgi:hypothetical protein
MTIHGNLLLGIFIEKNRIPPFLRKNEENEEGG